MGDKIIMDSEFIINDISNKLNKLGFVHDHYVIDERTIVEYVKHDERMVFDSVFYYYLIGSHAMLKGNINIDEDVYELYDLIKKFKQDNRSETIKNILNQ